MAAAGPLIYPRGSHSGSEPAQYHAAVAGALGGVGIVGHGLAAAVAHRPKLSRIPAVGREVEAYGLGALLRKLAVQLGIAHVIGVALHFKAQPGLGAEHAGHFIERGAGTGEQSRLSLLKKQLQQRPHFAHGQAGQSGGIGGRFLACSRCPTPAPTVLTGGPAAHK